MLRRHQVREYLKSTSATLGNYTNLCGNLVSETVSWLGSGLKLDLFNPRGLLRPDPALGAPPVWPGFSTRVGLIQVPLWYYHSVFVLDGIVHDPFLSEPIRVQRYLERYFHQGDLGLFLKDAVVIGSPQRSRLWSRLKRKRQDPENTKRLRDFVTALRDQFNFEWAESQAISPQDSFEASAEILAKFPWKALARSSSRSQRYFSEGDTSTRGYFPISILGRNREMTTEEASNAISC